MLTLIIHELISQLIQRIGQLRYLDGLHIFKHLQLSQLDLLVSELLLLLVQLLLVLKNKFLVLI